MPSRTNQQVARTADFAVRVFSVAIIATVPYSIAVSKLRRPFLSDRYFFIVVRLLRRREKFTEPDFALLARAFNRARALHPFYLTAWVFLPDHWHCICAPVYPVTISLAMKSVKQSSTSAVNQLRGADGELWQPRFFDRALRTVKEYNEKVEYIHLNPVQGRFGQPPGRLAMVKLQRIRRHERRRTKRTLRFDRRPRENALRSARTNLIAPSRGRKDADHKSGGPRYLTDTHFDGKRPNRRCASPDSREVPFEELTVSACDHLAVSPNRPCGLRLHCWGNSVRGTPPTGNVAA